MAEKRKLMSSQHEAAKLALAIPIGIAVDLLPNKQHSIHSLCEYKLPAL